MENTTHFGCIHDGAVVQFPKSAYYFMKVCTRRGEGGVVNLWTGELLTKLDLEMDGLDVYCHVVADSLDEFVREDESDCSCCAYNPWHH